MRPKHRERPADPGMGEAGAHTTKPSQAPSSTDDCAADGGSRPPNRWSRQTRELSAQAQPGWVHGRAGRRLKGWGGRGGAPRWEEQGAEGHPAVGPRSLPGKEVSTRLNPTTDQGRNRHRSPRKPPKLGLSAPHPAPTGPATLSPQGASRLGPLKPLLHSRPGTGRGFPWGLFCLRLPCPHTAAQPA